MIDAVSREDLAQTTQLLDAGADPNVRSFQNMTPLHFAAACGNKTLVNVLLAKNADVNALTDENASPLLVAAAAGSAGVVRLLLEKGADCAIRDKEGKTLLDYANEGGDPETISACEASLQVAK